MAGRADRGFTVSTRGADDASGVVIAAAGELDIASAPRLQAAVGEAAASCASGIIIDLGAVTFIDAAGLSALIALRSGLGEQLNVTPLSGQVERLVRMTATEAWLADAATDAETDVAFDAPSALAAV